MSRSVDLPHEIWYEIISQAIVSNVHDLATSKYLMYPRRRTNTMNIVTIPHVCREFRSITRKTILYTICGGVEIGYSHPHEPIRLDRLFAIFDYLRWISPTNYALNLLNQGQQRDGHRQRQGVEETIFSPHSVVIANVRLSKLKGLIKLYCDISQRHMTCFSALKLGMHQPALWLALLDRLAELLQSEHVANVGSNTKNSYTFASKKYQSDYREVHCAVLAYLSVLPSRTLRQDESQRMNSFLLFLRQLDRSSKAFDKMQQLTPDLLYYLFNTTGLGSMLEDSSKIPLLRTQANRLAQRWMPIILRYNHSHPSR